MNLYIRIVDGQPVDHPMLEDNLLQIEPEIDLNNLPSGWAKFVRVDFPLLARYEVFENTTYEWDGDVVKDVHNVRSMTQEEKNALNEQTKREWTEGVNSELYPSWIWNEERGVYLPPVEYPADGGIYDTAYGWNEENQQWELRTEIAVWNEETQSYDVIYPDPL